MAGAKYVILMLNGGYTTLSSVGIPFDKEDE